MRRLLALALCATSAAAAAVAHSLDNFVRPGVHHASFFDVDASVSAQTSAEGLDVIWANHLDETSMDVRETPDGLRLDYDVVSNSKKTGLIMVGRVGADPYACADAAYVSLEYRVLEASSRPGAARFMLNLLDASDCDGCTNVADLEAWFNMELDLDDASGAWRDARLGLCGDGAGAPFMQISVAHPAGNSKLDRDEIVGYRLAFASSPADAEPVRGAIEVRRLTCVDDEDVEDRCAVNSVRDASTARASCARIEDVRFDVSKATRTIHYGYQACCELCADDETCLYYAASTTYVATAGSYPSCYLFDDLDASMVGVAPKTGVPLSRADAVVEAYWSTAPEKRGALCDVCACAEGAADCRGRDLATVPAADGHGATALDLSGNPRLVVIGPRAFEGLALERLVLPSGLVYIDPAALRHGEVEITVEEPREPGNFIVHEGDAFEDVCCAPGETAAGLTFCEMDAAWPVDVTVELLDEAAWTEHYGDLETLEVIVPDTYFLSEASQSPDKCAAACARTTECAAYSWRSCSAHATSCAYHGFSGVSCTLHAEAPAATSPAHDTVGASASENAFAVSGLSPQARALAGARVVVGPSSVVLDEENGWTGTVEVSLGARPLRGAVWATPYAKGAAELAPELEVTFSSKRIVLYDDSTTANVTVSVRGVTTDRSFVMYMLVESCDTAFQGPAGAIINVEAADASNGSRRSGHRRHRRLKKRVIIGVIVGFASLCVLAGFWLVLRASHLSQNRLDLEGQRPCGINQCVGRIQR